MTELVNPLAAFRDGYGTVQALIQDQAQRRAGQALQAGNVPGATNALYGAGMLDQGNALQQQQAQTQRQGQMDERQQQMDALKLDEAHRKEALDRIQWLGKAVDGLGTLPSPEARKQAYVQYVRPILELMGATPQDLAEYDQADFSDPAIQGWRAALGEAQQKWQIMSLGNGGLAAVDPMNPLAVGANGQPSGYQMLRQPDAPKAPPGFAWGSDGQTLIAIPGGPADLGYKGRSAAATRAPKAAKKSGGSRYSDIPQGFE